jgi:hypothetical protein
MAGRRGGGRFLLAVSRPLVRVTAYRWIITGNPARMHANYAAGALSEEKEE